MAPRDGFEPPAKRLTVACSTAELPGNNLENLMFSLSEKLYSNSFLSGQAGMRMKDQFLIFLWLLSHLAFGTRDKICVAHKSKSAFCGPVKWIFPRD